MKKDHLMRHRQTSRHKLLAFCDSENEKQHKVRRRQKSYVNHRSSEIL